MSEERKHERIRSRSRSRRRVAESSKVVKKVHKYEDPYANINLDDLESFSYESDDDIRNIFSQSAPEFPIVEKGKGEEENELQLFSQSLTELPSEVKAREKRREVFFDDYKEQKDLEIKAMLIENCHDVFETMEINPEEYSLSELRSILENTVEAIEDHNKTVKSILAKKKHAEKHIARQVRAERKANRKNRSLGELPSESKARENRKLEMTAAAIADKLFDVSSEDVENFKDGDDVDRAKLKENIELKGLEAEYTVMLEAVTKICEHKSESTSHWPEVKDALESRLKNLAENYNSAHNQHQFYLRNKEYLYKLNGDLVRYDKSKKEKAVVKAKKLSAKLTGGRDLPHYVNKRWNGAINAVSFSLDFASEILKSARKIARDSNTYFYAEKFVRGSVEVATSIGRAVKRAASSVAKAAKNAYDAVKGFFSNTRVTENDEIYDIPVMVVNHKKDPAEDDIAEKVDNHPHTQSAWEKVKSEAEYIAWEFFEKPAHSVADRIKIARQCREARKLNFTEGDYAENPLYGEGENPEMNKNPLFQYGMTFGQSEE